MKLQSYLRCAFLSTLNIILYGLTWGHYLYLEGRVSGGFFRNWAKRYYYKPLNFAQPTTEAEIIELVKNARQVRVFGSAHSFNAGIQTDDTLISLDKYSGVISKELAKKQMTFKAGTRVRDVAKTLLADGLAFAALPSHDAQSIAGIISTDVHGTGRDWGFVSEFIVKLKLVDGRGNVCECTPEDELFKAAIGGIGAVGIITEVTVQAVARFHVQQKCYMTELSEVENILDQLIADNDHISLYIFPFTTKCQVNLWNRTDRPKSTLGDFREFVAISADSLMGAWVGNLMAYTGKLSSFSNIAYGLKKGTDLVLESNAAFNRSIYPLHQELEFTVPYEDSIPVWRRFIEIYEENYQADLPYMLFEVRFTPAGHDLTLIGPGRERRCTWIDLVCTDSTGFEKYYKLAEAEMKKIGARPHLGKFCEGYCRTDFEQLHGENFSRYWQQVQAHDPDGKFVNPFTRQLFQTEA